MRQLHRKHYVSRDGGNEDCYLTVNISTLKKEPVDLPETLEMSYYTTRRHILQDGTFHRHRTENLKYQNYV